MPNVLRSFIRSASQALLGYMRMVPPLFYAIAILGAIGITSVIIGLPLWYFSTQNTLAYTIFVAAIIVIPACFFLIRKLVSEKLLGQLLNFTGLCIELLLIMLLFGSRLLYYIPAILLSIEFVLFLQASKRLDTFIFAWMRILLTACSFLGFLYYTLILYKEKVYYLAIPLSIFYLFAFGFIIVRIKKRDVDASESSV
jgi:hypothetical protein